MPRVKGGITTHRRHKKLQKATKGFWGLRKNVFKHAREGYERSLQYAYRDRRNRKRDFRALWITRINAAARAAGITYSRLIQGLKVAQVEIDRKILAQIAVDDEKAFSKLVTIAKQKMA